MLSNIFRRHEANPAPPPIFSDEERRLILAEQQKEWEENAHVPMSDENIGELATRLARTKHQGDYRQGVAVTAAIDTHIRTNLEAKVITLDRDQQESSSTDEVHDGEAATVSMETPDLTDVSTDEEVSSESISGWENVQANPVQLSEPNNGEVLVGFEFDRTGDVLDWSTNEHSNNDERAIIMTAEDGSKIYIRDNIIYHYRLDKDGSNAVVERNAIKLGEQLPALTIGEAWEPSAYIKNKNGVPQPRKITHAVMATEMVSAKDTEEYDQQVGIFDEPEKIARNTERQRQIMGVQAIETLLRYAEQQAETEDEAGESDVRQESTESQTIRKASKRSQENVDFEEGENYEIFMTPENLVSLPRKAIQGVGSRIRDKLRRDKASQQQVEHESDDENKA